MKNNRTNKSQVIDKQTRLKLQNIASKLSVRSDVYWINEIVESIFRITGRPNIKHCPKCGGKGYVKE